LAIFASFGCSKETPARESVDRTIHREPAPSTVSPDARMPPVPGQTSEPPATTGPEVHAGGIQLKAPDGWVRKAASSGFVEAEFMLPRAQGDEQDGRLTVSVAAGSIEQNISRWKGQFGGNPSKSKQDTFKVAGMDVTLVDFTGTFNDSRGPNAPAVERPNYRMIAAIIPAKERMIFIKATGPEKTLQQQADKITEFVKTAKPE
jgi:hypothetical protein